MEEAVPVLEECLRDDPSALVRGHAAWALGEIGGGEMALREAAGTEADAWCLGEIRAALAGAAAGPGLG
jgi:epoxyqueuosine reductase